MPDIHAFAPLWGIWEIESLIGEGSYGKVYKAVREEFGNRYYCAVKHISIPQSNREARQYLKDNLSEDAGSASKYFEEIVADITNEINIMCSLSGNSNIVAYQEHLITPKPDGIGYDIFIKMELLTELSDRVRQRELTQQDVVRMGVDICTALEVCAAKKLIHRDIKPQNIFINDDGVYKLGDFGISRQLEKTTGGLSKKGTYYYMAPEVYRGDEYGASVDVYSLGLVMYRLLNGNRLPFLPLSPAPIRYDDNEKALNRRVRGEAVSAPTFADEALSAVILKMIAFNKAERCRTASEAKAALLALANTDKTVPMVAPVGKSTSTDNAEDEKTYAVLPEAEEMEDIPPEDEKTIGIFQQRADTLTEDKTVGIFSGNLPATNEASAPVPQKEAVLSPPLGSLAKKSKDKILSSAVKVLGIISLTLSLVLTLLWFMWERNDFIVFKTYAFYFAMVFGAAVSMLNRYAIKEKKAFGLVAALAGFGLGALLYIQFAATIYGLYSTEYVMGDTDYRYIAAVCILLFLAVLFRFLPFFKKSRLLISRIFFIACAVLLFLRVFMLTAAFFDVDFVKWDLEYAKSLR